MLTNHPRITTRTILSLAAFLAFLAVSAFTVGGCESYENGTTTTKTTVKEETPYESKTTTKTYEKKVEPY